MEEGQTLEVMTSALSLSLPTATVPQTTAGGGGGGGCG